MGQRFRIEQSRLRPRGVDRGSSTSGLIAWVRWRLTASAPVARAVWLRAGGAG